MSDQDAARAVGELLSLLDLYRADAINQQAMAKAHPGGPNFRAEGLATKASQQVYQKWIDFLDSGTATECEHDPLHSGIAFWTLQDPHIVCAGCFRDAVMAMRGTPEDDTCDMCRVAYPVGTTMRQESLTLQGGLGDDGRMICPLIICYAVCAACQEKGL